MISYPEWLQKIAEIGTAGVPYIGQSPGGGAGGWVGAPSGGHLSSVGDVKIKKKKRKKKNK